jgi:AAA domain-containing protein
VPAEPALASREWRRSTADEFILRRQHDQVWGSDVVLVDCPPSLGVLTLNALTAASRLLVVTEPNFPRVAGDRRGAGDERSGPRAARRAPGWGCGAPAMTSPTRSFRRARSQFGVSARPLRPRSWRLRGCGLRRAPPRAGGARRQLLRRTNRCEGRAAPSPAGRPHRVDRLTADPGTRRPPPRPRRAAHMSRLFATTRSSASCGWALALALELPRRRGGRRCDMSVIALTAASWRSPERADRVAWT